MKDAQPDDSYYIESPVEFPDGRGDYFIWVYEPPLPEPEPDPPSPIVLLGISWILAALFMGLFALVDMLLGFLY